MARAEIPERDCYGEEDYGDDWDERSVLRGNGAGEHAHAGVERREAKGNNPAEKELHHAAVNRKRVAAEGHHVPHGRVHADAIFEPERHRAEDKEDRYIDDAGAEAKEQ